MDEITRGRPLKGSQRRVKKHISINPVAWQNMADISAVLSKKTGKQISISDIVNRIAISNNLPTVAGQLFRAEIQDALEDQLAEVRRLGGNKSKKKASASR